MRCLCVHRSLGSFVSDTQETPTFRPTCVFSCSMWTTHHSNGKNGEFPPQREWQGEQYSTAETNSVPQYQPVTVQVWGLRQHIAEYNPINNPAFCRLGKNGKVKLWQSQQVNISRLTVFGRKGSLQVCGSNVLAVVMPSSSSDVSQLWTQGGFNVK